MTYYGRDQDIKEHIALKSFCSLSKTLIYFIVQISKRKPNADITLKGAKYFSISKFPLLKERKYLGSPISSLFSASTQFITTLQRVYYLSVFTSVSASISNSNQKVSLQPAHFRVGTAQTLII